MPVLSGCPPETRSAVWPGWLLGCHIISFMKLAQIAKVVSDSKIVGLGESTHGTHEFFNFKSDLLRRLVADHGFNTMLFEDSIDACLQINNYIAGGETDLASALDGLYPVWRTEELRALLVWLKDNSPPGGFTFAGFDIDQTKHSDLSRRDELMAENIKAYCAANPNTKAVVWAHNTHTQTIGSDIEPRPMGYFLQELFGRQYRAIALLFGWGSVSATRLREGETPGSDRSLSTIEIGSPPGYLAESALEGLATGPTFFDRDWLGRLKLPGKVRSIGWGLVPELAEKYVEKTDLQRAFDYAIYFPEAGHSHPLPSVKGQ